MRTLAATFILFACTWVGCGDSSNLKTEPLTAATQDADDPTVGDEQDFSDDERSEGGDNNGRLDSETGDTQDDSDGVDSDVGSSYACNAPFWGTCLDLIGSHYDSERKRKFACWGGKLQAGSCPDIQEERALTGTCVRKADSDRERHENFYAEPVACEGLKGLCELGGGTWLGSCEGTP